MTADEATAARLLAQAEVLLQQARSRCHNAMMGDRAVADVHARVAVARGLCELAAHRDKISDERQV